MLEVTRRNRPQYSTRSYDFGREKVTFSQEQEDCSEKKFLWKALTALVLFRTLVATSPHMGRRHVMYRPVASCTDASGVEIVHEHMLLLPTATKADGF